MAKDVLRFTTRVYHSHPLFEILKGDQRGGQVLLDFATAWYAYRLGQQHGHEVEVSERPNVDELAPPPIDGRLLDDALR